ncbi:MAG: FAD-dependent oxidoreductase [Alphaproteobacteria bacterium]|nr:MAG: FAD-dependent oxidoreductase [Alphaproteobacteria bacterium]
MPAPVLIVGGGIGGLTAALALARTGHEVRLFERAPEFSEVGAGLQLGPNAMKVLAALGVAEQVAEAGFSPRAAVIRLGSSGLKVFEMALGEAARRRWGAPYVQIHRADLVTILAEAAAAAGAELNSGCAAGKFRAHVEVTLELADGSRAEGAALIGADGLGSGIQAQLFGPEAPRFTGQVCWRATLPTNALPPGTVAPDATIWTGPGAHLVAYYLRGGRMINIVAVTERSDWRREGWAEPGDPQALRAAFAGWHSAIRTMLEAVERCTLWALHDRPVLPEWGRGPVTLLGDACHPMLPFLAQGAAMAIEDAWVLARCLQAGADTAAALRRYEAARRPRTARVQAEARRNARRFHRRSLSGRLGEFGPMALATRLAPGAFPAVFDWLYGADVTRVPG